MKIIVEFEFDEKLWIHAEDMPTEFIFQDIIKANPFIGVSYREVSRMKSGEITFDVIEKMVLDHCMITKDQLHLKSRDKDIVDARRLCYYLSKELHLGSARLIGKRFGNKDHATAYNGWLKATHYLQTDIDFKKNHKTFIESFFNHDTKDSETTKA